MNEKIVKLKKKVVENKDTLIEIGLSCAMSLCVYKMGYSKGYQAAKDDLVNGAKVVLLKITERR